MHRFAAALSLILSATSSIACSDSGSDGGGEETGGTGGSSTGGTSTGGTSTGGTSTGGSSTGGSAMGGSSGASTGGSATGGSGGSGTGGTETGGTGGSGGGGFTKRGICGQKGEGTVTATTYEGTESWYMVSQENVEEGLLDDYICEIRFESERIGEAAANCADLDGMPCVWTHKVRVGNPTVVTNVDGACEKNELVWNAAWIATQDGVESSYGYVSEYEGHNSVLMKASGSAGSETWAVLGLASWEETTGEFSFDNRFGNCRY
jgi:hypothetical protein